MIFPRQPMIGLVLAATIGIVVADWFPQTSTTSLIIFAVLGAVGLLRPFVPLAFCFVAAGFFLVHSFSISQSEGLRLAALVGDRSRILTATGAVVTEPKMEANGFATFLLKLTSVELEERSLATTATLFVRWRGDPQFGDELRLFGTAETIPGPRNPGEFDMRDYLARHDVRRALFVRYQEDGALIRHGGGNAILRAAQNSRAWMQQTLTRGLEDSPDVQNAICGMALGLRHQTRDDIEEPFQQTGTLHLFAVAGLHVGMVASLLWTIMSVARIRRRYATAAMIPLLLFYAAITGLHVSSVRAAVMAATLLGGYFVERKVFALNSLAAAAFGILCWNTNELFSSGFQLSFAVVGTILLISQPLYRRSRQWFATDPFIPPGLIGPRRRIGNAVADFLCRAAAVSFAAWIGSLPLIYWYYHLVTPVSLFANLAVVPIAYFILAIGTLSLVAAPLLQGLSLLFNNANWLLTKIVLGLVHFFSLVPGGHLYVARAPWQGSHTTSLTVLDVGTGAAVHLHSQPANWLFDCGGEREYDRTLRSYLHSSGVNSLAGLSLSHGDAHHIGGAEGLLADLLPEVIVDNAFADRSSVHKHLHDVFRQRGLRVASAAAPDEIIISNNVSATVLFPRARVDQTSADDAATVIMIEARGTRVLLMSDAGATTENALLDGGTDLHADILVKGQHHSDESGTGAFLDAVQPRIIVATSRDFPPHERINDEWAEMVAARGIRLLRQDETGAIELTIRDSGWEARAFITGEIFRINAR